MELESAYHLPTYLCDPYEDKIYTVRDMLNSIENDINILLHIAAENGVVEAIKILHECGANMDVSLVNGRTPVCVAAKNGQVEAIKLLHKLGANVNKSMIAGTTPMYIAAEIGDADVIYVLHKCGADVNVAIENSWYPLYIAAKNGHIDAIKMLYACGADMYKVTKYGWTPVFIAAENGHKEVINVLHECGADMNKASNDGCTPVYIAAFKGNAGALSVLHECGADFNISLKNGWTPVSIAAKKGHVDVLKVLHDSGANMITTESIALYKSYTRDINILKECGISDDVEKQKEEDVNGNNYKYLTREEKANLYMKEINDKNYKYLNSYQKDNLFMKGVKDKMFKFLTRKYLGTILESIKFNKSQGNTETYINFNRDDFKANCKGLGFPRHFQGIWLKEMQNPQSEYLPTLADGSKPSLEGIRFDIVGNGKFTTYFKWDLENK